MVEVEEEMEVVALEVEVEVEVVEVEGWWRWRWSWWRWRWRWWRWRWRWRWRWSQDHQVGARLSLGALQERLDEVRQAPQAARGIVVLPIQRAPRRRDAKVAQPRAIHPVEMPVRQLLEQQEELGR